jgi:DNA-binding response OmpR family regulator
LTEISAAPCVLIVNVVDGADGVADRLRADGVKVSAAITVEEVFPVLERLTPSAIIVDVPLTSAAYGDASFIGALRQRVRSDEIPIIVISPYRRSEDREHMRRAGADVFLQKPVLSEHLIREVRLAILARREGRRLTWNWSKRADQNADRPATERRARKRDGDR